MPALQDRRQEAFAAARAKGVRLGQAYAAAGYAPNSSHAGRLNKNEKVAERIAELAAERQEQVEAVSPRAILAALMKIAKLDDDKPSPAAAREARLALVELWRMGREAAGDERLDHIEIERIC